MNQISITRALTEIKHLKDRIALAIGKPFIGLQRGKGDTAAMLDLSLAAAADGSNQYKANYQAVRDMIGRYNRLKREIIKSNAVTMVTINGEEMTVAEAIERKSSLSFQVSLVNALKTQLAMASSTIAHRNAAMEAEINNAVVAAFSTDASKMDAAAVESISAPRRNRQELSAVDPNNLAGEIDTLQAGIDAFLMEVDFALAESNAKTMVND